MKKVAFHNLGCKVNAYEMELMQQKFTEKGYEIVPFSEKADIYVINTCTVTNIADRKSRQMLHRAKALNPEAVVVAAGCYVETDREGAMADDAIDILISNKEKADIVNIVEAYETGGDRGRFSVSHAPLLFSSDHCLSGETENRPLSASLTTLTDHTRAYIKIQDGCDQYCSYCIIPLARGHVVSRPEEETLKEIGELAAGGCREFVITGIHLSSYGLDKAYNLAAGDGSFHNRELTDIIKKISRIEGVERIRLGSLEPRIITDEFLEEMAAAKSFCPHFHLSLQSGCDEVLKRMNRRYDTDEYLEKVNLIRKYFAHPAITTDIIVGFPGETEEEFQITRDYLNRINFYETHVFAYSRRRGTVADKMPGQHTQKTKSVRSALLMGDSAGRAKKFREYYLDREVDVLIEESETIDGTVYQVGYNKEYVRFAIKSDEDLAGRIVRALAKRFINDEILEAVPL